jgi:hypothetical protein
MRIEPAYTQSNHTPGQTLAHIDTRTTREWSDTASMSATSITLGICVSGTHYAAR